MAASLIEIILRIKNESGPVFTQTTAQANALSSALQALSRQGAGGGQAFSQMTRALDQVKGNLNGLNPILSKAGAAIAGFFAISTLKGFVDAAAKAEVAGTVLHIVGRNAGIARSELDKTDKAIQKMGITAESSRKSLTQFIQAGLAGDSGVNLKKAEELARASQDLAVVSGQDSSDTFSRLILNIQQMDTQGLKFMGIMVQREDAEKQFAKSIGKSTGELTRQEKQTAFMNATLVESTKLAGTYEAAMGNVGKQLSSIARLKNELSVSIGQNLLPAYSALVEQFSLFLKEAKLVTDIEGVQAENSIKFGESVRSMAAALKEVALVLVEHAGLILKLVGAYAVWRTMAGIGSIFVGLIAALTTAGPLMTLMAVRSYSLGTALFVAGGGMTALTGTTTAAMVALRGFVAVAAPLGAVLFLAATAGYLFGSWLSDLDGIVGDTAREIGFLIAGVLITGFVVLKNTVLDVIDSFVLLGLQINKAFSGKKRSAELQKEIDEINKKMAERREGTGQAISDLGGAVANVGYNTTKDAADTKRTKAMLDYKTAMKGVEDAVEDVAAKERDLTKANNGTNLAAQESAKEALKASKAKHTDAVSASEKILSIIRHTGTQTEEEVAKTEKALEVIRKGARAAKEKEALDSARTKLGVTDKDGVRIAAGFEDIEKAFIKTMAGLKESSKDGGVAFKDAFDDAAVGIANLIGKAKSVEDIATALGAVSHSASMIGERVKGAKETLIFNQEKAALSELNGALAGFLGQLDKLRSMNELIDGIMEAKKAAAIDLKKTFLDIGQAGKSVSDVLASLESTKQADNRYSGGKAGVLNTTEETFKLTQTKTKMEELAKIDLARINDAKGAAEDKYKRELALLEEVSRRQSGLADEQNRAGFKGASLDKTGNTFDSVRNAAGDVIYKIQEDKKLNSEQVAARQAANSRMQAIDSESNQKRIAAAKQYFETLKGLQAEALAKFKEYSQRIIELDAQIKSNKESLASEVRDLQRKDMTEAESDADRLLELEEIKAERLLAIKAGNFDQAKEFLQKEIDLTKSLNADGLISNKDAITQLTEERTALLKIQEEEKASAKASAAEQLKAYQDISAAMEGLSKTLGDLAGKNVQKILLSIDEDSLKAAMSAVTDAFSKLSVKVNVSASGTGGQGYATGGQVQGPGSDTSDNLMAWVSPGEFWTQAKAVRHYGANLFHSLNNMTLPKESVESMLYAPTMPRFAMGGMVGGVGLPAPIISSGGSSPFESAVNITLGGKKVSLKGQRDQVRGFVDMLKTM